MDPKERKHTAGEFLLAAGLLASSAPAYVGRAFGRFRRYDKGDCYVCRHPIVGPSCRERDGRQRHIGCRESDRGQASR